MGNIGAKLRLWSITCPSLFDATNCYVYKSMNIFNYFFGIKFHYQVALLRDLNL